MKYVKVVLTCVCGFLCIIGSVSLSCAFLEECTGVSLCTFVVSLACYYLTVSTYSTVCLITKEI